MTVTSMTIAGDDVRNADDLEGPLTTHFCVPKSPAKLGVQLTKVETE
jgi:hypothetical protein